MNVGHRAQRAVRPVPTRRPDLERAVANRPRARQVERAVLRRHAVLHDTEAAPLDPLRLDRIVRLVVLRDRLTLALAADRCARVADRREVQLPAAQHRAHGRRARRIVVVGAEVVVGLLERVRQRRFRVVRKARRRPDVDVHLLLAILRAARPEMPVKDRRVELARRHPQRDRTVLLIAAVAFQFIRADAQLRRHLHRVRGRRLSRLRLLTLDARHLRRLLLAHRVGRRLLLRRNLLGLPLLLLLLRLLRRIHLLATAAAAAAAALAPPLAEEDLRDESTAPRPATQRRGREGARARGPRECDAPWQTPRTRSTSSRPHQSLGRRARTGRECHPPAESALATQVAPAPSPSPCRP
eukprot:3580102-Prymnesium_polylepis.2